MTIVGAFRAGLHVDAPAGATVDGRIDNAAEVAAALDLDPATPVDRVVARGYATWGTSLFKRLRGGWVVLAWDEETRTGAIARDRTGERPLHFAASGTGLVFGPEVTDVLGQLPNRPQPDDAWLAHWLTRRTPPAELTPYAGVRRLPVGHAITFAGHSWRVGPWWRPQPLPPEAMDAREATERLRAGMTGAVERAVGRARAPGVRLSGGFDSAAVAALAGRVPAYSGVFPGHPEADESERIATVREALGLPGVEGELRVAASLAQAIEFIRRYEVPPASPNAFVWDPLYRRAAADGIDVLLDGEGGDELFGLSPYLLADALRRGDPRGLLRLARQIPGMGAGPPPRWVLRALAEFAGRGSLPPGAHRALRALRRRPESRPDWLSPRAFASPPGASAGDWKGRPGPRWWAFLVDATGPTPDAIGAPDQLRREGEVTGVELVHPWRDTELVDLVLRMPPELAFDADLDRPIARAAMAGLVPDIVRTRSYKPFFNSLLVDALTGADAELAARLARRPELGAWVRPAGVDRLLARPSGPAWPLDVWRLAVAGAWLAAQEDRGRLDDFAAAAGQAETHVRSVSRG